MGVLFYIATYSSAKVTEVVESSECSLTSEIGAKDLKDYVYVPKSLLFKF